MASGKDQQFLVRFWGVRGSYPTPGPHTVRHGGNTSCVEIRVGRQTLIFDAGSGIISLGNALIQRQQPNTPLHIALFITHGHGDHLVGFPFFAPLFDARTCISLFGPQLEGRGIEQLLTPLMSPPYFPVDVRRLPSQKTYHTITDGECVVWPEDGGEPMVYDGKRYLTSLQKQDTVCVRAKFMRSHPLNGSVVYRIEYGGRSVVYATDVEWDHGCDTEFINFVAGSDILIHDAQYTDADYQQMKHGFGHSTVAMATEAAVAASVGELILFHHEPTYDDNQLDTMEAEARTHFPRTRSAHEGMEIDLLS